MDSGSETFIHALEVIQCSHKRWAPAFVMKLEFAKAFGTVNWSSLHEIFQACDFLLKGCSWTNAPLSTSKSAILVNGCSVPWFLCKWGLRQGDPLSPYSFLVVADVLQRLIHTDRERCCCIS
jgi:hypothetical protein